MHQKLKKRSITAIKLIVSFGLIAWVMSQLNWKEIQLIFKSAQTTYLVLAVVVFLISQWFSVLRFNLFIRKIGIRLPLTFHWKLYLLGMFYNFFLPGGVGGDAYKAYFLSKNTNKSLKKVGQIVFIERFLGIVAIGFLLGAIGLLVTTPYPYFLNVLVYVCAILCTFFLLKWIARWLFVHKKRIHWVFTYSMCIQLLQLLCVFFLLKSFHIDQFYATYLLLFLISSVLSVISFAGLGIREAVFMYGAVLFQFNPEISTTVALSFSLITALVSFFGVIYLVKQLDIHPSKN